MRDSFSERDVFVSSSNNSVVKSSKPIAIGVLLYVFLPVVPLTKWST